jgi:PPOX class probable F420-dependent enzyme
VALDPKIREFLNEKRYAVLATINRNGTPQQSVMWYLIDGDTVVMNTARGRVKDKNMVADQRVSICIEDEYRYVTIAGVLSLNDDQTVAQADIRALAARYEGDEEADRMMAATFGKQERVSLRLPIGRVDAHGF